MKPFSERCLACLNSLGLGSFHAVNVLPAANHI